MRDRVREIDGRLVAAAAVLLLFGVLLVLRLTTGSTPWNKIGVEPGNTIFADLYAVTTTWDCEQRGIDPFPDNPCNPLGAIVNFPRLWIELGNLGLDSGDTKPLAVALAAVFFAAAVIATGPLGRGEGLVYAAALLSPAVLLGVQRGNVDLLMFALVVAGVLLVRRSVWAGAGAIVLAAVLKLFPLLALPIFVRRRTRWAAGAAALAVFALYVVVTLDDIRTI